MLTVFQILKTSVINFKSTSCFSQDMWKHYHSRISLFMFIKLQKCDSNFSDMANYLGRRKLS